MIAVSSYDHVIKDPKKYVSDILNEGFKYIEDGRNTFKGIQLRDANDEFGEICTKLFPGYYVNYNFVRRSPLWQSEPNYIHTDEMMGDITCILYLNEQHPYDDGTIIYDENDNRVMMFHSRFNRMMTFNSEVKHSRSIYENFGDGDNARLIQVVFLKKIP
jgi:hypothetical protein